MPAELGKILFSKSYLHTYILKMSSRKSIIEEIKHSRENGIFEKGRTSVNINCYLMMYFVYNA